MDTETARKLLEQKIAYLNMVGNVSMLWWVTSVVFCVSILVGVWKNKEYLTEQRVIKGNKLINGIGIAVLIFLATVVAYGFFIIRYLGKVQKEISEITVFLNAKNDFFSTELSLFWWAMVNGTSSFVGILILWVCMWRLLEQSHKE